MGPSENNRTKNQRKGPPSFGRTRLFWATANGPIKTLVLPRKISPCHLKTLFKLAYIQNAQLETVNDDHRRFGVFVSDGLYRSILVTTQKILGGLSRWKFYNY